MALEGYTVGGSGREVTLEGPLGRRAWTMSTLGDAVVLARELKLAIAHEATPDGAVTTAFRAAAGYFERSRRMQRFLGGT